MGNKNSDAVKLSIDVASNGNWKSVKSDLGHQYYYQFTGGDDGDGGMQVSKKDNEGPCLAHVHLKKEYQERYEITGCQFDDDTNDQLSWKQKKPQGGVILNWNEEIQSAYYHILVKDKQTGGKLDCDPTVKNKPVAATARNVP